MIAFRARSRCAGLCIIITTNISSFGSAHQLVPLAPGLIGGADIDAQAVLSARANFKRTPWAAAVSIGLGDFRKLEGDYSGAIVERCGLKGTRVGGAVVSEKHANFIVNDAGATASDIVELMTVVREAVGALASEPISTRLQVKTAASGATILDDSYNANPASMLAALGVLSETPGHRYALLGDMLELGDEAPAYHRDLATHIEGIDGVYCVGPLMRELYDVLPPSKALGWSEDPVTLDPVHVAALFSVDDVVVVKGSKKMFWVNKFVPRLVAVLATDLADL